MRYPDEESFTELDTPRRGRQPRRRWTGSMGQRARAARGLPPAVFKISSYSHSAGGVRSRFAYISREGALEAEGPDGELRDREQLEETVADWEALAEEGGGRRYAMSALVSFPAGVDEEKATAAARAFFKEAFGANHDYVFAGHQDTKNFHVHIVVQAAGHDGKQIRIQRADIQDLRMLFAEKAAAQGIELDASPRWAWPELELAGAFMPSPIRRTQLEALAAVRRDRDPEGDVRPLEYARAAERVMGTGRAAENNTEKVVRLKAAIQLARFGLHFAAASRGRGDENAAEAAAVVDVVGATDSAINAEIRGLGDDPAAKGAALEARRGLGEQLAAWRPEPERRWARAAQKPGPWAGCQALEYARAAGEVALQLDTLANDQDRVAAVKGAVELARFGWALADKAQGTGAEQEEARAVIDKAERALRFAINDIEDPQGKREAIQARQRLYKDGVREYREARRPAGGRDPGRPRPRGGVPDNGPPNNVRRRIPAIPPPVTLRPGEIGPYTVNEDLVFLGIGQKGRWAGTRLILPF